METERMGAGTPDMELSTAPAGSARMENTPEPGQSRTGIPIQTMASQEEFQTESKAGQPDSGPRRPKQSVEARKRRRKRIRIIIILAVIAAVIVFFARRFLGGGGESEAMILTDFVRYGAITATVEGSGVTRAKNSETMTTPASGTVREILVEEGDAVSILRELLCMEWAN